MIYKLINGETEARFVNNEPFVLIDDEQLNIEFDTEPLSTYVVELRNGDEHKQIVADGTFVVPQELLHEGELQVVIKKYDGRRMPKVWVCEPIKIVKTENSSFRCFSSFSVFESKLNEMKGELAELRACCTTLQNQINEINVALEQ